MPRWKADKVGGWEPGHFSWDEPEADLILSKAASEEADKMRAQIIFQQKSGLDIG